MKADENIHTSKTGNQKYKPVKPFAFEAWKIWNNLTTSAELLWEEYETDFIQFCCNNTHVKRKMQIKADYYPF